MYKSGAKKRKAAADVRKRQQNELAKVPKIVEFFSHKAHKSCTTAAIDSVNVTASSGVIQADNNDDAVVESIIPGSSL